MPTLKHLIMEGLTMRTVLPNLAQIVRTPSAELACRTSSVDQADPWHRPFAGRRARSIAEANSITNCYYDYSFPWPPALVPLQTAASRNTSKPPSVAHVKNRRVLQKRSRPNDPEMVRRNQRGPLTRCPHPNGEPLLYKICGLLKRAHKG